MRSDFSHGIDGMIAMSTIREALLGNPSLYIAPPLECRHCKPYPRHRRVMVRLYSFLCGPSIPALGPVVLARSFRRVNHPKSLQAARIVHHEMVAHLVQIATTTMCTGHRQQYSRLQLAYLGLTASFFAIKLVEMGIPRDTVSLHEVHLDRVKLKGVDVLFGGPEFRECVALGSEDAGFFVQQLSCGPIFSLAAYRSEYRFAIKVTGR